MSDFRILILTKGFAVTRISEEFQVVVPRNIGDIKQGFEAELTASKEWPGLLADFYRMAPSIALQNKCVLIKPGEICSISVCPTIDKFQRPNVIVVVIACDVDWNVDNMGSTAAHCQAIGARLCGHLAELMRSDAGLVDQQLRAGTLFTSRHISRAEAGEDFNSEWDSIFAEIRRWNGIRGLATRKLIKLGANIVLGTESEAQGLLAEGASVDAFLDPRKPSISPITQRIVPFVPPTPESVPEAVVRRIAAVEERTFSLEKQIAQGFAMLGNMITHGLEELGKAIKKGKK